MHSGLTSTMLHLRWFFHAILFCNVLLTREEEFTEKQIECPTAEKCMETNTLRCWDKPKLPADCLDDSWLQQCPNCCSSCVKYTKLKEECALILTNRETKEKFVTVSGLCRKENICQESKCDPGEYGDSCHWLCNARS